MQQVVRLLGNLGERYGAEHTYTNLRTPAEAIKLLCINLPELQEELLEAHNHGIGYRLIQADADLGYEDLQLPLGSNNLILTPVVMGSGDGLTRALVGVGLVIGAFFTGGATIGLLGLAAPVAVSTVLGGIGASLILGGVTQMLSPQPQLPNLSAGRFSGPTATATDGPQSIVRGTDGRQSYAYTGAANTVGVGATIPVAYGEVLVGSHLLSANVDVTDESDPLQTAIRDPGPNTVLIGGEKIGYTFVSASGVEFLRINRDLRNVDDRCKVINTSLALRNGNSRNIGNVDADEDFKDTVDVIFELRNGLFDFVSGAGSTKVDGYITYKIELRSQISGPDPTTGTSQATIQGLLLRGQTYRWMHRLSYTPVPDDGNLEFFVEIIDYRAHSSCDLIVHAFGYQLNQL